MSRVIQPKAAEWAAQQTRGCHLCTLHQALLPISVSDDDELFVQGFRGALAASVGNMSLAHLHVNMMRCKGQVRLHVPASLTQMGLGLLDVVLDTL